MIGCWSASLIGMLLLGDKLANYSGEFILFLFMKRVKCSRNQMYVLTCSSSGAHRFLVLIRPSGKALAIQRWFIEKSTGFIAFFLLGAELME